MNPDFIIEQSETSDSRPYLTTVNISPFNTHIVHKTFDKDDNAIHHQPTTPQPPSHITRDTTESIQILLQIHIQLPLLQILMLFKCLPTI